jgi:hypothetical protein
VLKLERLRGNHSRKLLSFRETQRGSPIFAAARSVVTKVVVERLAVTVYTIEQP